MVAGIPTVSDRERYQHELHMRPETLRLQANISKRLTNAAVASPWARSSGPFRPAKSRLGRQGWTKPAPDSFAPVRGGPWKLNGGSLRALAHGDWKTKADSELHPAKNVPALARDDRVPLSQLRSGKPKRWQSQGLMLLLWASASCRPEPSMSAQGLPRSHVD